MALFFSEGAPAGRKGRDQDEKSNAACSLCHDGFRHVNGQLCYGNDEEGNEGE